MTKPVSGQKKTKIACHVEEYHHCSTFGPICHCFTLQNWSTWQINNVCCICDLCCLDAISVLSLPTFVWTKKELKIIVCEVKMTNIMYVHNSSLRKAFQEGWWRGQARLLCRHRSTRLAPEAQIYSFSVTLSLSVSFIQ